MAQKGAEKAGNEEARSLGDAVREAMFGRIPFAVKGSGANGGLEELRNDCH